MDLNVSSISFGRSTRNWGARGIKAPNKKATLDKLSRMGEDFIAKQRPIAEQYEKALRDTAINLTHELKGMSLKDICNIFKIV